MWLDVVRTIIAIMCIGVFWWILTAVITPYWDSLYPMIQGYDNSFSQNALNVLDMLKAVWGAIPLLLTGVAIIWIYVRAQKREPDTYYVPPGGS